MINIPRDLVPDSYLRRSFHLGLLFQHPWAMVITGHEYDDQTKSWRTGKVIQSMFPSPPFPMAHWTIGVLDAICRASMSCYTPGGEGFRPVETGTTAQDRVLWWVGRGGELRVHLYSPALDRETIRVFINPVNEMMLLQMTPEFGMVAKGADPGTIIPQADLDAFLGFIRKLGIQTQDLEQSIRRHHEIEKA